MELYQKASTGRDKYGGYVVRIAWPRAKCFHTEFAESPLKNISEVRCQAAGCRDSLRNFSLEAYRQGQESVWDYPRPPRLEDSKKHIQVICKGGPGTYGW